MLTERAPGSLLPGLRRGPSSLSSSSFPFGFSSENNSSPGERCTVRRGWGFAPGGGGGTPERQEERPTFTWPCWTPGSLGEPSPVRELRDPSGRVLRSVQQDGAGLWSPVGSCSTLTAHGGPFSRLRLGLKDRRQEKGTTEDEMAGWHHRLSGYVWVNSGSW